MRVIKGEYWEGALRLVREVFRGSGEDDDDDGGDCDGGAGGGDPAWVVSVDGRGGGCMEPGRAPRAVFLVMSWRSGVVLSCPVLSCPVLLWFGCMRSSKEGTVMGYIVDCMCMCMDS